MNAVIYARYSSDNQREESIEGQLRECSEFAERKGYTVINTYADRAISGKKADNRPQFMQMIADSRQRQFEAVIVWKIDRFSRDKYDSVFYKNALMKNGVSVISAKEPIDDTPEGQLMESIFEGFSVYFIKDLSAKVSRGMTENVLKGKFNGGTVTFGYKIDKNRHFVPDPVNAPVVRDVFERYASGENSKDILKSLTDRGVTNRYGKSPSYNFITHLLNNRRYLGEYRFRNTVVENAFEPLVSKELFDKCQKRLKINNRTSSHFKHVEDTYILTGKMFCGHCGSTMVGVSGTGQSGKTYRYYHCTKAKKKHACSKKRINKELIEDIVIDRTLDMLSDRRTVERIARSCYELQKSGSSKLIGMKTRLKQIEREIDNIMSAIKQGIFTASVKTELEKAENKKSVLEHEIATEESGRPILSMEQIKYWICKFKMIDRGSEEQKRRLIDAFVNSIYVYDDKILILYNYKDGEDCVPHSVIRDYIGKKENSAGRDRRSSLMDYSGTPSGIRRAIFAYRVAV